MNSLFVVRIRLFRATARLGIQPLFWDEVCAGPSANSGWIASLGRRSTDIKNPAECLIDNLVWLASFGKNVDICKHLVLKSELSLHSLQSPKNSYFFA